MSERIAGSSPLVVVDPVRLAAAAQECTQGRCCVGDEQADFSIWRRCSDGKGEFGEDHLEPAAGLCIEAEFVGPRRRF